MHCACSGRHILSGVLAKNRKDHSACRRHVGVADGPAPDQALTGQTGPWEPVTWEPTVSISLSSQSAAEREAWCENYLAGLSGELDGPALEVVLERWLEPHAERGGRYRGVRASLASRSRPMVGASVAQGVPHFHCLRGGAWGCWVCPPCSPLTPCTAPRRGPDPGHDRVTVTRGVACAGATCASNGVQGLQR